MTSHGGGSVRITAPAKVNLTLRVHGRRDDGFHELTSLVIGVGLADTIYLGNTSDTSAGGRIQLSSDEPSLPDGDDNLVMRAARLLAKRTGTRKDVNIGLEKRIPIGAGMGGGSSDAAAVLRALNDRWQTGRSVHELSAIGAELGSDIPLFFHLPSAVVRGRGERVEPVPMTWSGWIGLVLGGEFVSTPAVYAALNASPVTGKPDDERIETAVLGAKTANEIGPHLVNDLEPGVFRVCPKMKQLLEQVNDAGGRFARISGAGSTIYSLFDRERDAHVWADAIRGRGLGVAVHVVRAPVDDATAS
jgi:4-diphosphocytidyl-2-C-methyl-D-erythritol kinase